MLDFRLNHGFDVGLLVSIDWWLVSIIDVSKRGLYAAQMRFRRGWLVGGHRAYDVKLAERLADSENLGRGEGDGE